MKRFCPFQVAFPVIGLVACNSDEGLKVYNANPSTQIVSPDDGELVAQNSTIVLRGVASDPNHTSQQLVTRWLANNVTVCDSITPDSMGFSHCEIDVADDDLNIVFEAQDPNNAIGWSSIELAIAPSLPPSAIISSPIAGDVYYSDQPILFTGTISDQEDAPNDLQFTWHSDVDGQVLVGATVELLCPRCLHYVQMDLLHVSILQLQLLSILNLHVEIDEFGSWLIGSSKH